MRDTERWVELGVVGRPHGVRGAMRAFLHNRDSDFFASLQTIFLLPKGGDRPVPMALAGFSFGPKAAIIELDGVHHRDEAQALNGAAILVDRAALPEVDDDEFYVEDLMGLRVVDGDLELGRIVSSRAQGGIEVVTVKGDEHELEVPIVEDYVVELDVKGGVLKARDTEGLPRSAARRARKDE